MQALYAFFQADNNDLQKAERQLHASIDKVYELYIFILSLVPELADYAAKTLEDAKLKRLPTKEDLNPNTKFVENKLSAAVAANKSFQTAINTYKISWANEQELIKKIFLEVKASELYSQYMSLGESNFIQDRDFMAKVVKIVLEDFEPLNYFFEEKSIIWTDDFDLAFSMAIKTIRQIQEAKPEESFLLPLYKDEKDDRAFMVDLFRKTVLNNQAYEKLIGEKTQNWEVERIAMMDVLLMKMAITEILNFSNIPTKVSLNEYIELSKNYSTPKSQIFVNGILDKLLADFKANGELKKTGRGLME
ncbi:MAG: transcription antitermination factor NusB [Bacteroidetes bacterium]|nr:transcription antitermination factor NusB [Bacteroidota bacterium]